MSKKDSYVNGVRLDFIHITEDGILLEGCVDYGVLKAGEELVFSIDNKKKVIPTAVERKQRILALEKNHVYDGGAFKVKIVLDSRRRASIGVKAIGNDGSRNLDLVPQEFTRLGEVSKSYVVRADFIYYLKNKKVLAISPYKKTKVIWHEVCFLFFMLFYWRLGNAKAALVGSIRDGKGAKQKIFNVLKPLLIIGETVALIPRAYLLRMLYRVDRTRKRRPIWLISDRGMSAGDNGEALFRYIMQGGNDRPADIYFVISKKSKHYSRLQDVGPVIDQDSFQYKRLFLLADKIISSQADVEITNPFLRQRSHYIDLYAFDFVFLQHGIIRHDLSLWLNRFNKNIHLFITSAQREYDSIVRGDYYYSKDNVLLSGLPRYDYLEDASKGKLILAPTYRKDLVKLDTDINGARGYDNSFKESRYYEFYNDLMNDSRVLAALRGHGMTGELYLHPVFAAQIRDFVSNDVFSVKDFPYDYKTAFREGSLLVSDYSSVMFDFAYLKKPVIYSQFDKESFFATHMYQESEFFSDERDGFGDIASTYEDTVSGIINTIESGCVMEEKYAKRVDQFFYRNDKDNSKRVYDAILKS